ncbi:MAG: hypothetical protein LUF33_02050 [Clostridiales bacterium]|nr:hypothetical protein [Clostridiales bacterium]
MNFAYYIIIFYHIMPTNANGIAGKSEFKNEAVRTICNYLTYLLAYYLAYFINRLSFLTSGKLQKSKKFEKSHMNTPEGACI